MLLTMLGSRSPPGTPPVLDRDVAARTEALLRRYAAWPPEGASGGAGRGLVQAFAHIASTMDKVGDGMRRTAEHYQRTDDTNARLVEVTRPTRLHAIHRHCLCASCSRRARR